LQLKFVTHIFVNAMGKMKEVFIKDIEDFGEHRDHIDDEYQYRKYLQKKAMKEFKKAINKMS
jgi:hypothetical protein